MQKKYFPLNRYIAALLLLVSFAFTSCEDDEGSSPSASNAKVNDWILENMEFWYYWNTQLPGSTDKTLAPDQYFESLLVQEDRFSWIQDDYQELLNSLQGISKEAGFEFVLYLESQTGSNVVGQIMYVKPNSSASAAGLKRGDVFSHINNQQLTTENYQSVLSSIDENFSMRYKALDVEAGQLGTEQTISLQPVEYTENPIFLSKTFDIGGHKIGYFVYNFFANGVDNGGEYESQMQTVFSAFKTQGITDLVLDLRFNSGGVESAANSLASHIGKGLDVSTIFSRKQYNADVQQAIIDDPDLGEEFLVSKFQSKSSNIGNQLGNGRVYILTGTRTASASELVINALKPYMDVFLIGDVTVGKNVGSISLYEENDPKITWGMQPIVVKIFNSQNQSDYGNGFSPNILDEDRSLSIYPLGDERETLLAHAIEQITGVNTGGRKKTGEVWRKSVGHSLDMKRRSFQLVVDEPRVKTLLK